MLHVCQSSPNGFEKPELRVLLAAPRGFCAGVRRAINAVRDALKAHGGPVYVRRPIVHNLQVVRELEAAGAIFVEELDEVPAGAVVLFSAHGVAPDVAAEARRRGLVAYDAVCPLVAKVHREVERHQRLGRTVILVGHHGHPEIEGTLGHISANRSYVVANTTDVAELPIPDNSPAAYAIQTTFSVDDAADIVAALRARFSDLEEPATSDICYATTNRQLAVRAIAANADAVIVAGEGFSSNACRLAELAATLCTKVQRVATAEELDLSLLSPGSTVGITSAASTPKSSVEGIITRLGTCFNLDVEEVETASETVAFKKLAIG